MPQNPVASEISRVVVWHSFRRLLARSKMKMLKHADYEHIVRFFLSLSEQKEGLGKRLGQTNMPSNLSRQTGAR